MRAWILTGGLLCFALASIARGAEPDDLRAAAQRALDRGVQFYARQVSAHGGYVYRYSADLTKQEGEGVTTPQTVWVQPPGTPSVGEAYLRAWQRTKDPACLAAAKAAAECLIQGQYRSGGWNASIEFDPAERAKQAYRVDPPEPKKRQRNTSSLDDDKTTSALRFLMRLDHALEQKDARLHEATEFALNSLLAAQFPNGAWAQIWVEPADTTQPSDLKARFPKTWPREYPGGDYWFHYTFNDNNISETITTLFLAEAIYGGGRYRAAAKKAGEFILLAQLPEPQPAWAQQYNFAMEPVWARKFEPPAVTGGESQKLLDTLLLLTAELQDRRFLEPIPRALAYLRKSQLPDGQLARFYELETNRPLYFTKTYQLTDKDDDLPTHYGFKVSSKLDSIAGRYQSLEKKPVEKLRGRDWLAVESTRAESLEAAVRKIVAAQDERGAWVEDGKLKYHGKGDNTRRVIESATFIKHLDTLSQFLAPAPVAR